MRARGGIHPGQVSRIERERASDRNRERGGGGGGGFSRTWRIVCAGEGNANSHGASPIDQIISTIKRILTRRLSIKLWLSAQGAACMLICSDLPSYTDESALQVLPLRAFSPIQGYLANKKPPTPLGKP
jgi:hypothetical protein